MENINKPRITIGDEDLEMVVGGKIEVTQVYDSDYFVPYFLKGAKGLLDKKLHKKEIADLIDNAYNALPDFFAVRDFLLEARNLAQKYDYNQVRIKLNGALLYLIQCGKIPQN